MVQNKTQLIEKYIKITTKIHFDIKACYSTFKFVNMKDEGLVGLRLK